MLSRQTLALAPALALVLITACTTPTAHRVHTSAGVPQMPIVPYYPTKKRLRQKGLVRKIE
jgi:outer membrane biogenesis lipoprotein LolB